MIFTRRLWLIGDDEVLDVIADLSRHLDYFQVARVEDLPATPFDQDDHLIIATVDEAQGSRWLGQAALQGAPGHLERVPPLPGMTVGARAIAAAAALVARLA